MAKEVVETSIFEKKKLMLIMGILIFGVIFAMIFLLNNLKEDDSEENDSGGCIIGTSEEGVTRYFSSNEVNSGEEIKICYDVVLNSDQRYFIFKDKLPVGFESADCKIDDKNQIVKAVLQNTASTVETCTLKAPSQPGTYSFGGAYGYDGLQDAVSIKGSNIVVVN